MSEPKDEERRPSMLGPTLKTVAIVGLLSYGASVWLSESRLDQSTMARLASASARGQEDPLTTGSLGRSASGTKLDPCAVPRR